MCQRWMSLPARHQEGEIRLALEDQGDDVAEL
jgi:hypothetical protein